MDIEAKREAIDKEIELRLLEFAKHYHTHEVEYRNKLLCGIALKASVAKLKQRLTTLGLVLMDDGAELPEMEFYDCCDIKKSVAMTRASEHTIKLMLKAGYRKTHSLR